MAVEEGLGIAFLSRLAADRGLALGRVVDVAVEGMALSRPIYLSRNRRQPLTRAQIEFWEFVSQERSTTLAKNSLGAQAQ
jgi:DNA-binding transcriptional LysR family regulator